MTMKSLNAETIKWAFVAVAVLLLAAGSFATYHFAMEDRWTRAIIIGVAFPLLAIYDSWRLVKIGPEAGRIGFELLVALGFTLVSTFSAGKW